MSALTESEGIRSFFGPSPSDWCVERIRNHLSVIVGGEWGDDVDAHDEGIEIPVVRVADIRGLDIAIEDLTVRRVRESKVPGRLIGKRTLLFEKSGGGEQKPVGRCVLGRNLTAAAICSNFMAKVDCGPHVDPLFVAYLLDTAYSSGVNTAHIQQTTGIQNLRIVHYLNTKAAFPNVEEQQRIAAYLDASCAAIDAAIGAKRRQIETLDELKRVTLHDMFGDKHWPFERIKDVSTKIGSGVTPEGGASGYVQQGIPLLRSQNIHFDGLRLDDVAFITEDTHAQMANSQLKPRDVLLNITGASIGRCTFVPDDFGEGNVNQHVCIIRCSHKIDHRFLTAFLASPIGQGHILSTFTGASRQGLSHRDLGLFRVPLPPLDVQQRCVSDLEQQDRPIARIRDAILSQVTVLLAYRKSLIHECVTGQRRISDAEVIAAQAATLPS